MSTCPNGHESTADDWCDVCGTRLTGVAPSPDGAAALAGGDDVTCPHCGITQEPGHRFCEVCGADLATGVVPAAAVPAPAAPTPAASAIEPRPTTAPTGRTAGRWEVAVTADRAYFDRLGAEEVDFPVAAPTRSFPLADATVLVGRRSARHGIEPGIDLSGAPEDPGVSRAHCSFVRQPDGTYAVVDGGSTNGTRLNEAEDPIPVNVPQPVADGDRVHVGAWTTLTVRRR